MMATNLAGARPTHLDGLTFRHVHGVVGCADRAAVALGGFLPCSRARLEARTEIIGCACLMRGMPWPVASHVRAKIVAEAVVIWAPYAGPPMLFLARSAVISVSDRPASASTSSVCAPSSGDG
jgi:hypothetical protein